MVVNLTYLLVYLNLFVSLGIFSDAYLSDWVIWKICFHIHLDMFPSSKTTLYRWPDGHTCIYNVFGIYSLAYFGQSKMATLFVNRGANMNLEYDVRKWAYIQIYCTFIQIYTHICIHTVPMHTCFIIVYLIVDKLFYFSLYVCMYIWDWYENTEENYLHVYILFLYFVSMYLTDLKVLFLCLC